MRHLSVNVVGDVQGVFFRASTKEMADELGVKGFVRNEPDGSVYIEAEAQEDVLEKFITWCHQGPAHAVVHKITMKEEALKHFVDFKIQR